MENRHGLAVGGRLTSAGASAERDAAVVLAAGAIAARAASPSAPTRATTRATSSRRCGRSASPRTWPRTPPTGAARSMRRTTRHPGYAMSQREAQARRRDLRLAQDGRAAAPDAPPRLRAGRLDVSLRPGRVQLGPHSEPHVGASVRRHDPVPRRRGHGRDRGRGAATAMPAHSLENGARDSFTAVFPWPASRESKEQVVEVEADRVLSLAGRHVAGCPDREDLAAALSWRYSTRPTRPFQILYWAVRRDFYRSTGCCRGGPSSCGCPRRPSYTRSRSAVRNASVQS